MKSLIASALLLSGSAFAGEKISCELQAYKAIGSSTIRTSRIMTLESDTEAHGEIRMARKVEVSPDNTLFVYVKLNTQTRELRAEVRDSDTHPGAHVFGVGVARIIGELSSTSKGFRLAAPLRGTIAEGFLKDREDPSLVGFDSVELICVRN